MARKYDPAQLSQNDLLQVVNSMPMGAVLTRSRLRRQMDLSREWPRGDGLMKIDRLLVDMGYKPGIVNDVKRRIGGAAMMPAKGVGIRASRKPLSGCSRQPGEVHGHYWYIPKVRKTAEFPHVMVAVNRWKTFVHAGRATAAGERPWAGSAGGSGGTPRQADPL